MRALGTLDLKYVMTILIRESISQYVSLTARCYLEMQPLLGLYALATLAIEVNMSPSLKRVSDAGGGYVVLTDCSATSGAVPKVPNP